MKTLFRILATTLLGSWLSFASAQELDLNALLGAGQRITQIVDQNQAGTLWDGASALTRKSVTRDTFANAIQTTRRPLGAVVARNWSNIARQQVQAGAQVPPGTYINIEFSTTFAAGQNLHELISFRLDEDKVWRFTGYFLR